MPISSSSEPAPPALSVDSVSVRYGGIEALVSVSLSLKPGQMGALIGPNGAGKSTLFHAIAATVPIHHGDIALWGQSIKRRPTQYLAALGLARVSQHARLFERLSVQDNLSLATQAVRGQRQPLRPMGEWIDFVKHQLDLHAIWHSPAGSLPLALQRRVELARSMVAQPRVLLLDEPAAGQTEADWQIMVQALHVLRQDLGTAVLLIEHRLNWVWALCEVCWVLDQGRLIAHGTPEEVRVQPQVIEAYLGEAWHAGA